MLFLKQMNHQFVWLSQLYLEMDVLKEIDKQVDNDLAIATGDISELAGQVVDIVINRQTNKSTFIPIRTTDEFLEQKKKRLEDQIEEICNPH